MLQNQYGRGWCSLGKAARLPRLSRSPRRQGQPRCSARGAMKEFFSTGSFQIEPPPALLTRSVGVFGSRPAFPLGSKPSLLFTFSPGVGCPSFGGQRTVCGLSCEPECKCRACAFSQASCTLSAMQVEPATSPSVPESSAELVRFQANTASNPSFERTFPGVPVHAAQLKR